MAIPVIPGLNRYTPVVSGVQRAFTTDVQAGLNNPALFIFWSGGENSSTKLNKLFGAMLKKYNAIGIYMEALPVTTGKANFDIFSRPEINKDVAFYNYILQQFPNSNRVWVSGISTGACFAVYLGAWGFAGSIATFAGSIWKGLVISHKPNVYAVHGKGDRQVWFNGGKSHGADFYSAYASIEMFSTPPTKRTVKQLPLTGELNTYTSPNQPNWLQLVTVADLAHNVIAYKGTIDGFKLIESVFLWFRSLPVASQSPPEPEV